ncbi:MAG TPA: UDP-N-acetylmuramoyl-tripeptide--D-alanyl-D-alanine ligase, partial [Gemmatimonadaceae bacterium]|nr:UDP-N-acetylmuramoyl-tripeptide--D-alanyl-D-alanine ligase [Gemmatimonadaceae bacterium]
MSTATASVPRTTFWNRNRVGEALAGLAHENLPRGTAAFGRVWTDTRTIEPGDLFVALAGERFDAHDFLAEAVAKGASGLVVSKAESTRALGVPTYVVPDTLVALGALATYRRRAWSKPVVGVVGTNGKTSTKELLRAALGSVLDVHATTGNLNNLVGVPLTLLALRDEADVAVVEMGTNQPGEVSRLRAIVEPNITVVTSVAEEHLEGLGDLAGVLREELSAAEGVAVAVVPASQPEVVDAARKRARRVVAAGLDAGDVRAEEWKVNPDGSGRLRVSGVEVRVPLRGVHNLRNAMLALAVARELGVSMEDAARGIAAMAPPPMRANVDQIGSATLINDAYNSNPGSARAAIELLCHAGAGRQRVAVLATMLELGPQTPRLHEEVARHALDCGVDVIGAIGEFATALERIAPGNERVVAAGDVDTLWQRLSSRLSPDAVILLKGSRGMRLERLVAPITDWARQRAGT